MSLLLGSVLANTLASLSGGGAGLLQFPLLLFLGLPFSVALATHKLASVALGLGAVISHFKNKNIHSKVCLWIITFGSLGVILGAHLILLIPEVYAQRMLGVIILLLGVYSRLKTQLGHHEIATNRNLLGWCFGTGLIILIGIINGSLTAGSGLLVTLLLVRWFGYSYKQAVAMTMISVGLVWNALGVITILNTGVPVHWPWLPLLLLGSFIGGILGASLTHRLPNYIIKVCFEVVTLIVGLKLLI